MARTVLEVAQSAALREGLLNNISSVANPTSNFEKQFSEILQVAGRSLTSEFPWVELVKTYFIQLVADKDYYSLPADFLAPVYDTYWQTSQNWPVTGPMSPQEWMTRKFGWVATGPYSNWNVTGSASTGTFRIDPIPETSGDVIAFQYISSAWTRPTNTWTELTPYTTSSYVYVNEIRAEYGSWTAVTGSWTYSSAFAVNVPSGAASIYSVGDLVQFTQGTSATIKYFQISAVADTSLTLASVGAVSTVANQAISNIYYSEPQKTMPPELTVLKAGSSATSGTLSPTMHNGYYDQVVPWTPQSYERFVADTDVVLIDDELLALGTIWRYLRSTGKPFEDKKAEYEAAVREHFSSNKGAKTLCMSTPNFIPLVSYYNIPDTGIGL